MVQVRQLVEEQQVPFFVRTQHVPFFVRNQQVLFFTRNQQKHFPVKIQSMHCSPAGFMAKIADGRYGKGEQLIVCQMPFHMGKVEQSWGRREAVVEPAVVIMFI
ncbi:hypothetical protein F511_17280 [Dorcoceras hygrometricum]|uniref:Uncharacterized protein n=1 Tax=Dorcoceras hygrometricum TaxID=472368 RepID=A0A2Z7CJZ3_9LAMI|nr:hypothetical protein F511_17280 [Dorcoceras hygrometricum]